LRRINPETKQDPTLPHGNSSDVPRESTPLVSIVIPAFDEEEALPSLLHDLINQSYQNLEILLVDDGSTDRTLDLAKEWLDQRPRTKLISTEHRGPSHARNVGLANAAGEIVFFAECDCTYTPDYVTNAVKVLADEPGLAGVCLTGSPLVTKSTFATQCIDFENRIQHEKIRRGNTQPFYAWVYKRDVLDKVGGFDETLFQGEDRDLFRRITSMGLGIGLVKGVNWQHKHDETITRLVPKWYWRSKTRTLFLWKHRLVKQFFRPVAPLWTIIAGLVIVVYSWWIGLLILAVGVAIVAIASFRYLVAYSGVVRAKSLYAIYPFFATARNWSIGLGYTAGIAAILLRRLQGKAISWQNL
jgi:glycosyltransferase involved in cell wall biosynthesis